MLIISFLIILFLTVSASSAADMNETADGNHLETYDDNCLEITDDGNLENTDDNYLEADNEMDIQTADSSNRVSDKGFEVTINKEHIIDNVGIDIKMPKDAKSNLTIAVDGKNFTTISSKEVFDSWWGFQYDFSQYGVGKHNMTFTYDADDYYFFKKATVNMMPFRASIPSTVMIDDDTDDMGPSILFSGISGLKGNIKVYIDEDKVYDSEFSEYDIEGCYLGGLELGNHEVLVKFTNSTYSYSQEANIKAYYGFSMYTNFIYGKKTTMRIGIPKDLGKSKLTVKIDGKNYKYTRYSYYLAIKDLNLDYGKHTLTVTYAGDKKYEKQTYSKNFNVKSTIEMPENYQYATSSDKISLILPKDAKGNLHVHITYLNGTEFVRYDAVEIPLSNGKASYSLKKLPLNREFYFDCYYTGDDYKVASTSGNYKIIKPKISGAKDIEMSYLDGTSFKVKVTDSLGNPLDYEIVSIKIDGKKVKRVWTDDDGIATYKITQTPKKYKITAEILGIKATKKLTVKQILSLKKVKIKKSAKKLVLTATLKKVKGKYLEGKKITFKFNGKTYKTKTNKKGVAKVTIKKKVLKKLKKGKKIKYQATYVKDTVKRTAKVK